MGKACAENYCKNIRYKGDQKGADRPYEIKEGFVYLVDYKIKDISSFM